MKKLLFFTLMTAATITTKSQIVNNSFENLNPNGTIKNWGDLFIWSGSLDTNGVWQADSVIFDNELYFSTNDANTGLRALEMRNAFNFTTSQKISGSARLSQNDTAYAVFTQVINIPQRPSHFSFFHKFFPVANDTAYAQMTVLDTNGNDIGSVDIDISAPSSVYSQISKPVIYTSNAPGAYIMVGFKTAKPYTTASFGTRLLIDDVNILFTGLFENENPDKDVLTCFPNPAPGIIHLLIDEQRRGQKGVVEVSDFNGKIVRVIPLTGDERLLHLETADLADGPYSISLKTAAGIYRTTFIK